MKMKAIARFGKEFGSYRMVEVPYPTCGPEDIILEIKAAAICGADMKHWRVDNGSDEFNSIRGHEFAGEIVQVGEKVTSDRVIGNNDIITIDLSPQVGNIWGDYARTIIVENGMVVEDIGLIENPEWKEPQVKCLMPGLVI